MNPIEKPMKGALLATQSTFTSLMAAYQSMVWRLASRYFRDPQDRDDVVQETFLRVYTHIEQMNSQKNVVNWIYTIGRNVCLDVLRKKKRQRLATTSLYVEDSNKSPDATSELMSHEPGPEERLIQNETSSERKRRINDAFYQIPGKWRHYFYQRYYLEMTVKDISVLNDIPENTAKTYLFRGRKHMKQQLVDITY
ncbi:RNA polymerase sigma-70 factor (ECF subfamily) [Paenibacillus sp. 4624]|uniref:RNA polymerase sigma factor n=1 Tax=Paenibacillus sp. 4624 TaxID=3156453 RepID=UPI003D20A7A5